MPPAPIRQLRDLTRYRKALTNDRTRAAGQLHKVFEDSGVRLTSVASHVLGVSARAMLTALVGGTRAPETLADLARGRLRAKPPALRKALCGRFGAHDAFVVSQLLGHVDYLEEAIDQVSLRIDQVIAPYPEEVKRLDAIHGVTKRAAEVLIAEIGPDMTVFPTARHLASWAGCVPATTSAPARRARAMAGFGPRSPKPRRQRPARGTARWPYGIAARCVVAGTTRRSSPSLTPFS